MDIIMIAIGSLKGCYMIDTMPGTECVISNPKYNYTLLVLLS